MTKEKTTTSQIEISSSEFSKCIYTLRGIQVMLDCDLAKIYKVKTGPLNEAVKRNMRRFPHDFIFKTTKEEIENLKSQSAISSLEHIFKQHGGSRHTPFAFTELGVAMLSSVLSSEKAIEINIEIMRAFVQLRKQNKAIQLDLIPRMQLLENELTTIKQKLDRLENRKNLHARDTSNFAEPEQVRMIQDAVAHHWGLTAKDLKSAARSRDIALPRHIAIYLVRKQLHMSFTDIGKCFGQRDHTTVLYAYRRINAELDANRMIQNAINSVQGEINLH